MKRLFFGAEMHAPWPSSFPKGRLIEEPCRHVTLAFLGQCEENILFESLKDFPKIHYDLGEVGIFEQCLILPSSPSPHVVAWQVKWLHAFNALSHFQSILSDWLKAKGYALDSREWLPHVTLCRQPFDSREWEQAFAPLPCYSGAIHLYESEGNLKYVPLWSYPVMHPFEEFEHTADMAFWIRGKTLSQLYDHAFTALAFKFPPLLAYLKSSPSVSTLEEVIMELNEGIGQADGEIGCPMKAVSFHGEIQERENGLLQWEMIVDV